ncbi:uncharacterized protein LOC133917440 [Phragmites australis]|uniref:uncharacterized protein LOC133917440 n=1 Tax=Phragmites australis TaxID=29695 RepID=UPI002D76DE9B|nr:uncharacterized protein LOC133917440 [Phragmites australis]
MDKNGGVKVTYIETLFVTSDATSFKGLVQRLTGRSGAAPVPAALHRPQPPRAGAGADSGRSAAAPQAGYYSVAPPCLEDLHEMGDLSDLLYATASERRHGHNGGYSEFPY